MSDYQPRHEPAPNPNGVLTAGVVVVLATMGAWLWAEAHNIETTPLLAFIAPVVAALLIWRKSDSDKVALMGRLNATHAAAEAARTQTNGALDARIAAVVRNVLAERDAAKAAALATRDSGSPTS